LTRYDQKDEKEFICFAYKKINWELTKL
jgi:hypothetical protein